MTDGCRCVDHQSYTAGDQHDQHAAILSRHCPIFLLLSRLCPRTLTQLTPSIALWHPSIFGYNFPHPAAARVQNYNNNKPVNPMRGMDKLPEEKWFGGGLRNYPPAFGDFLPLEVGKVNTFEIACNRAFTTYGDPNNLKPKHKMACEVGLRV